METAEPCEIRDAREYLSRRIDKADPGNAIIEDVLSFLEAAAALDHAKADAVVERMVRTSGGGLYNEVGKMTRRLHDSLKAFRHAIDPRVRMIAAEAVPNAIDSLRFVIGRTEEAANGTMEIVEKHLLGLDEFSMRIRDLRGNEETVAYLADFRDRMEDDLTRIITNQSFQDITGQTIKKVITLVEEVEKELVGIIASFGLKTEAAPDAPEEKAETVSQAGVDDLLKEFGF